MTTTYHIADISNIALAGHGASGKTSLADALLHAAGATARRGSVDDGTSLADTDDEEKRRHFSIDAHLLHLIPGVGQPLLVDVPADVLLGVVDEPPQRQLEGQRVPLHRRVPLVGEAQSGREPQQRRALDDGQDRLTPRSQRRAPSVGRARRS